MKADKARRLAAAGWQIGSTKDFLKLSPDEAALIEMRLALAERLRAERVRKGLTQLQFSKRLASSQSRVAKMEAADGSVSIDLLVRGLLALGATRQEVGRIIGKKRPNPAA